MKKLNIFYILIGALLFGACNDFLDETPDNRTELNTNDKINSILISAYPQKLPHYIAEISSDNVMDNGKQYDPYNASFDDNAYLYETIENESLDDCPAEIWSSCYMAIAAANQALKAIDDMGNPGSLNPQRAEALLCRAYGHFVLVNIFCQHYEGDESTDMGIPYMIEPETKPIVQYERGTVSEVYAQMNKDIEEALPMLDDNHLSVPKYHFNKKAAYAFATRFNLYYRKYDKVIEYATKVLGNDPISVLRNYETWKAAITGGATEIKNIFPAAEDVNNLLVMPTYSAWGRGYMKSIRYGHGRNKCSYETFWAKGPWGSSSTYLIYGSSLYGSNQNVRFPKCGEFFEYTDKAAGIGYVHVVRVPFRTEETLLCRAEAYAMTGNYDAATADLAAWQKSHCIARTAALTRAKINSFYSSLAYSSLSSTPSTSTIKNKLHPRGFTVSEGEQENFVDCILHFRRLETMHEGLRWYDIKRFGIVVEHNVDGGEAIVLDVNSPRRAIQLPNDVINAGLAANPEKEVLADIQDANDKEMVFEEIEMKGEN